MKKIIWLVVIILIIAAIVYGVSATDLVNYVTEFVKELSVSIIEWLKGIAEEMKNSFSSALANSTVK